MKHFSLWTEGYQASGDSSDAIYHADIVGKTFDLAVRQYVDNLSKKDRGYWQYRKGQWTYWGCRAFDNEADARKSFG